MEVLLRYFPELSEQQILQFSMLDSLYRFWNEKINVISRKDIGNLYLKHVLHSLVIAKIVRFVPGTRIADIGTGGGFPGIPLAILFPSSNFHLYDSIGKKIKVVNLIIGEIGIQNAQGINSRAEQITEQFDFVVSRAVTTFPDFFLLVKNRFLSNQKNQIKNGILYLKGGDIIEEANYFMNKINFYPITEFFKEEFFETKLVIHLPC